MSDATSEIEVTVTEAARKKFHEIVSAEKRDGHGLRLFVRGGGTPDPEFGLNFVEARSRRLVETHTCVPGFPQQILHDATL